MPGKNEHSEIDIRAETFGCSMIAKCKIVRCELTRTDTQDDPTRLELQASPRMRTMVGTVARERNEASDVISDRVDLPINYSLVRY